MVYQTKGEIVSTELTNQIAVVPMNGPLSKNFFLIVTNSTWNSVLYDDAMENRRKLLGHIKKLRILINSFFVREDRTVLFTLLSSASPVADCANITGTFRSSIYRKLRYLRRVLHALYDYFEKKTYRDADKWLKKNLSKKEYKIFAITAVTRNAKLTGKVIRRSGNCVCDHLNIIYGKIKEEASSNEAIKDLFEVWIRIMSAARSYKSYYVNETYMKDLKEFEKNGGKFYG